MIDLSEFFGIQASLLNLVPEQHSRFLMEKISWDNRLLGIVGPRGTGKTTLLLQHLAEQDPRGQQFLYLSADHVHVQGIGLYEIASQFFRVGGKTLIVDEIHKYLNWSQELKNLYDAFPNVQIQFSGSSTMALQAGKADLSRRAVFHELPGLSFREYLRFAHGITYDPVPLNQLLQDHVYLASEVLKQGPILGHFSDYVDHGFYPFFLEGIDEYYQKIRNVIEKTLYEDIPAITGIRPGSIPALKRILWLIATSQPFTPNIERMSRDIRISKEYVYAYLDSLERAGLIAGYPSAAEGYRFVRKPAKIYLENTNLLRTIAVEVRGREYVGTARETFFANQLRHGRHVVTIPKQGDFLVDGRYVFEIGGRRKTGIQLPKHQEVYVVCDDTEIGTGHILPLWLFGFLY